MKAFVLAVVAIIGISLGAQGVLNSLDFSSATTFSRDAVRLGE